MTGSPVRFRSPAPFPGRPAGTCGRTSRPETATPRPFGGRGGSAATRSDSTETGSFENRPSRGSHGERLGRSRDRGPDPDPGRRAPGRGGARLLPRSGSRRRGARHPSQRGMGPATHRGRASRFGARRDRRGNRAHSHHPLRDPPPPRFRRHRDHREPNPAPWNALKLFGPGGTFLAPAQSEEVAGGASQGRASWVPNAQVGALRSDADAIFRHREAILSVAGLDRERIRKRRFRVVVDATNGAGSEATPALLEALGCEVDRIFCVPDGRFPRVPEPLPENLGALRERVRATGAAIGFANDPDADRLAMVDERGEPIGEERTLQIAIDWALALAPGPVAVNSSTSMAVDLDRKSVV